MPRSLTLVLVASVLFLSSAAVHAQSCPGANRELVAYASETLTITTSVALGFTKTVYAPSGTTPAYANFSVATNPLNVQMDGTAPTSSVGVVLPAAAVYGVCGASNISRFLGIATGGSATVNVIYFKAK